MNSKLIDCKILRKTSTFSASFFKILILLIGISFNACKESDTLGGNLLPADDQSQFKSSGKFNLTTFTIKEDSLKSDDLSSSLLGSYVDPVFGKTTASFLTQFVASSNQLDFGSNPIADSIILSMTYSGYYGKVDKRNGLQKIKIYRVDSYIYKDSAYYSSENPYKYVLESGFLSEHAFLPDPTGKYQTGTPVQKFNLPISLGQNILDNKDAINSGGFLNFFRGLYFKPVNDFQTSGNGAILSFNLVNSAAQSKLSLYFHNDTSTAPQKFDMPITSDCSRINFFNHERNGVQAINNQLADTTKGKTQLFVQNMAGLSSKIWFTNLESWKDSLPLAITKAELVIPVESSSIDIYGVQSRLILVEKDENGEYTSIPDFDLGDSYFNGYYNPANQTFRFNIALYLQEVLSGKRIQKGLYLVPTASAVGANRVVLKGSDFIKLNVTYTKIN
jgi:hypothetical protein